MAILWLHISMHLSLIIIIDCVCLALMIVFKVMGLVVWYFYNLAISAYLRNYRYMD